MDNYSDGLASGLAIGQGNNNGWGNGAWGADFLWIIVLFALLGNGGWGWGGNGGGNCCCNPCGGWNSNAVGYELGKVATSNDVAVGFAQNATLSSLNDLKLGQAGIQQTLCQGFGGVNTAILQAQNGIQNAICQLGYEQQNCCCQTQRAIDGVNYNMAQNTCNITNAINTSTRDIIDAQRDGTNAILNFLTQEKISSLQAENAQLTAQLSQNAQTRTLIDTLRPCPQPAYITCSPYQSIYGVGYNNNCGCGGCGCGC